ncbi:MAG: CsbD family protein [Nannocystaceae bacterium]
MLIETGPSLARASTTVSIAHDAPGRNACRPIASWPADGLLDEGRSGRLAAHLQRIRDAGDVSRHAAAAHHDLSSGGGNESHRNLNDKEDPGMGERIDETKGAIKERVGGLTGNEDMEREGKLEKNEAKAKREAEGVVDEAKGKVQETWGDATDDPEQQARGKANQAKGEVERSG